jgi:CRP-like cAMP-binding protein
VSHSSNFLLASLPASDIPVLLPHLKTVDLLQGRVLLEIGDTIRQVYFPHSGVVSLVVPLASGETIESAMIGREGVVGGSSGLNGQPSVCKAIVQIAGKASVLDTVRFRGLADGSVACRTALFKHESNTNSSFWCRRSNPPRATQPTPSKPVWRDGFCAAGICRAAMISC